MFVDEVKIYAKAGDGGNGCVAFLREKGRPKGGPCGGNGGRGGHVILEADHDINNLIAQFYQPRLIAEDGEHGKGKGMDGRSGSDLIVKVPCGTLVWRLWSTRGGGIKAKAEQAPTEVQEEDAVQPAKPTQSLLDKYPNRELIADLVHHGQRFILCRGGRGGLGNKNFANPIRQVPRFALPGEPGEEGEFILELRIIADIGLVGYPNAGKSTLLAAISRARPKIAPYPFTTLHPNIGIVEYPDFKRVTVCDVPGLIEGAHMNVGLGHSFLRHIQRCKGLVLLIDMAGTDGRNPWDDYYQLLRELELYDLTLLERPRLVVANKMDEPAAKELLKKFKRRVPKTKVLEISAAFGINIDKFKEEIRKLTEQAAEPIKVFGPSPSHPLPEQEERTFQSSS
jgi:GTP-binding protein